MMKIPWSRVYYFISDNIFESTIAFEESVLVIDSQLKHFQFVNSWPIFKDIPNVIQTTLVFNTFIFLFSKSPKVGRIVNSFGIKSNFNGLDLTLFYNDSN